MQRETNRERFKRLATFRTNEVLQKLKILGNCANRYAYEYSQDDIEKIFSTIEKRVKQIKTKFHSELSSKEKGRNFKL